MTCTKVFEQNNFFNKPIIVVSEESASQLSSTPEETEEMVSELPPSESKLNGF